MPLDCGKNPLLADLNAKKKALADQLANLDTLGEQALNDIKTAAQEQLDAMNLSVPKLPEIPNFQDEIDKLVAKAKAGAPELLNDLQELEKNWGGLVDNIGDVLDVVKNPVELLNIDLCKSVPKVEAKVNPATGELEPTPTSVDVVENIEGNPEQSEPEPAQPATEDLPRDEEDLPKTESEFTVVQARKAKAAIIKAEKEFMKNLRKKMDKALEELYGKRLYSNMAKYWRNTPISWKNNNPEGQVVDYYLTNPDVKVPKAIDDWVFYNSKKYAYANMEFAISKYYVRIINTLGNRPDIAGNKRWTKGEFNKAYKEELMATIYYDLGFGIREYNPEYGFGVRKICGMKESELMIPSSFQFKHKDYRANFTPYFYNLSGIRKGTYSESDTEYSNMINDYVSTIFNTKVTINKKEYFAFLVMLSWTQNTSIDELEDYPRAENFIPNVLGGALPLYEDILLGTVTDSEASEMQKHSESNFTPHFMYKESADGKKYVTQYTNTYDEHKQLANLGYVHKKPQ